ncbi:MAG TPA: MBL fold metallo-hydrolase [Candidatus Dormibacteraeota bacterium]|nr:MBL fold metallo-hydrolase [Candidatus Dormibacteraeota bacterium]
MDRSLAPGVWQIDTLLGGWKEVNSVFLIEADQPCLVETGPQRDVAIVLEGLRRHGLGPDDLAWIVLSHIHLDHAGAVGEMAQLFPQARVICHPRGLRHLADPARLISASAQVYGPRLDSLYGRMTAVNRDRLVAAEDRGVVELGGGKQLLLVHSPGHAKHHIGVLVVDSGVLLVGDAVGVKLPGAGPLRPATPPDDFDLQLALDSLHTFQGLRPEQLILTHFGSAGAPEEVLGEAEEQLRAWAGVAQEAYREHPAVDQIEMALRQRFSPADPGRPDRRSAADTLNGTRSNAEGLFGWLERQRAAAAEGPETGPPQPSG